MWDKTKIWLESVREANFDYLSQNEFLIMGGVALALLFILLLCRLRPARRIRAFSGETGSVEISRSALLNLVYSACEQLPEVRKPTVKIRGRRKLSLSVRIQLDASAHLRDTASYLQSHLKDALENNLGVEKLGKIEILVTGVKAASKTRSGIDLNRRSNDERSVTSAAIKNEDPYPPTATSSMMTTPKPDLSPPIKKNPESAEQPTTEPPAESDKTFGGESGTQKT